MTDYIQIQLVQKEKKKRLLKLFVIVLWTIKIILLTIKGKIEGEEIVDRLIRFEELEINVLCSE